MKVLTLKQPFAELVVSGKKTIELRKWNTNFRGKFLIHSSRIPDKKNMKKFGFENLPNGFILGEADLVNVKKYNTAKEFNKDKNKHLAAKDWGAYGFILKNIKRITPISARGQLNFWEFSKRKI
ncbi:MAG: ASCH domain-containing protein [Candidatus Pacearchaeota archaeon]|nr:ASCH domain-containing protein [Candidatus Pacearchaeota archaeon]